MEFQLKKWSSNYLDDFITATNDPHISENLCEFLPYPMDTAFALEYIKERMLNSEERQICRAVIIDGHAVGGVDVVFGNGVFAKSAELSIWLAAPYRGKGIGANIIKAACEEVFDHYDIIRIEAHPYANHSSAESSLLKAGFIHEGTLHSAIYKNGQIFDYDIFALIKA